MGRTGQGRVTRARAAAGRKLGRLAELASRAEVRVQGGQPWPPPFDWMVERCIVEMGRCASGKPHVLAYPNETSRLIVGSFSSLAGTAIFLLGGDHHAEWVSTCPFAELLELPGAWQPTSRGDIVLGSDVWVGTRATVLSGVSIGHGAVVGAGAVVTRDVRPYAVVGGVPAREVRRRFSDEIVDALLRIAWWEWPMEQVRREVGLLRSPDVKEFVERFDQGRQ